MGLASVIVRIGTDDATIHAAAMRALRAQAMVLKGRSQAICPVEHGTLRDSCVIEERGDYIVVGYGGAASDYALIQHENLQYHHNPGQQAKYLEQPLDEMEEEIKEAVSKAVAGAFR